MIQIPVILQKVTLISNNFFITTRHHMLLKADKLIIQVLHIKFIQIKQIFNKEILLLTVLDPI